MHRTTRNTYKLFIFIFVLILFSQAVVSPDVKNSTNETIISNFEFTYTASSETSVTLDANSVVFDGSIGAGEYANTVVLDSTFTLYYTVDGDTIYMGVNATAAGWVSIGWGTGTSLMNGFDYIIAYYDTSFHIQDSYGDSSTTIAADTSSDIISSAGSESDGHTIFEFSRLLDTGDALHDVALVDGESIPIHWGYDLTADDYTATHDSRGKVNTIFTSEIIVGTIPDAPVLTHSVDGESIILNWDIPELF